MYVVLAPEPNFPSQSRWIVFLFLRIGKGGLEGFLNFIWFVVFNAQNHAISFLLQTAIVQESVKLLD